ncbi:MAG: ABC transporter permease [Eubacteriales bacterium]|nr:ABC transporter permease [Eubacteriales bacterium]
MKYIIKRILQMIPSVLLVLLITFTLSRIVPGDPARMMAGEQAPESAVEQIREEMGLNKSIPEQFIRYVGEVARGDLGTAWHTGRPVTEDFAMRLPASIELALCALLLAVLIGVPVGVYAASKKDSAADHVSRVVTLLGTSVPVFWLGFMLIWLLYAKLEVIPAPFGRISDKIFPPTQITGMYILDSILTGDMVALKSAVSHIFLPAVCLSFGSLAIISRMTRSNMIEVLNLDYIRTARSKGIRESKVIGKHGLRNILVPVLTVIGAQLGGLIGNAVVVETIFNWPGIGSYITQSILQTDYAPVQAFTVVSVLIYMVINLILDILYAVVDPRITY